MSQVAPSKRLLDMTALGDCTLSEGIDGVSDSLTDRTGAAAVPVGRKLPGHRRGRRLHV